MAEAKGTSGKGVPRRGSMGARLRGNFGPTPRVR
jgi:hypothetical protein